MSRLPFLLAAALLGAAAATAAAPRPNILFILTDDLGYGDLGSFYQDERALAGLPAFDTPHLDTMAAAGIRLTRHYCPAPVCAPSRASLLLGVHQGHSNIRNNQFDKALEDNHTLGTVLQAAGYATAVIGKWGLQGGGTPPNQAGHPLRHGFDFFFGLTAHLTGHYHYAELMAGVTDNQGQPCAIHDGYTDITAIADKCYSTDLFTARAKKWIADHHAANPATPFFLYLALPAPHARLNVPTQAYPAGGGLTGGVQWTGTPDALINTASGTIDSWIHPDYAAQAGWSDANKRHATMIRRIDDAVADLLQLLADLGIADNTLLVFTADNGPHDEAGAGGTYTQDPTFFRSYAGMDGIKRDAWEGGLRVPAIALWPAHITPGAASNLASQFHDWMATFAELAGVPAPARSDGISLVPTLTGSGTQQQPLVYVEYHNASTTPSYPDFEASRRGSSRYEQQVIHLGGYKGIRRNIASHATDFTIYDTAADPKETTPLAAGAAGVPTQQQFKDAVLRVRRPNSTAARPYDAQPVPAVAPASTVQGLEWKCYERTVPWVPQWQTETPAAAGTTTAGLDLSVRTRDADYGILFSGYLQVPADGVYTFHLTADTGAFVRLHDVQLVDADFGYAGGTAKASGTIPLQAGKHPLRLWCRHADAATHVLSLEWSSAAITRQPVPASACFRDGVPEPAPPTAAPDAAATTGSAAAAGAPVLIDVLANDSDDGTPSPLAITAVTTPANGTAVIDAAKVRYTPRRGFFGTDGFHYTISDGADTATATVTVAVHAAGDTLWLPLDETAGAVAHDAGGRPLGTLAGFADTTSCWVASHWTGALAFDGSDDKVTLAGHKGVLGPAARTIAFWLNAAAIQTAGARPTMVSWGAVNGTAYGARCDANLDQANGYPLRVEFNGGGMNFSTPARGDLRGAGWVHCTVVIPAGARFIDVLGYLDGSPATATYVGGQPNTTPVNTTAGGDVTLGTLHDGSALRSLAGLLDDVRIYPRALSAAEVATLHAQTADETLRAAWHFRHGGSITPTPADWAADADHDGLSALLEFALGGNPTAASPGIAPALTNQGGPAFVFNRRQAGIAPGAYAPQYSETLLADSWVALTAAPVVAPHPHLPGFDSVAVALPPSPSARGFVRLRVDL